jgi:PASTA domain
MAARLTMLLPRFAVLVLIWLLAAASFTFAAGSKQPATQEPPAKPAPEKPKILVAPDVRRQAYVFAKGILQDAGFAWRVDGSVKGYAANTVVVQNPAPGTRVIDNGAPVVVLRLQRNAEYAEHGLPENHSPFSGTSVVLLSDWRAAQQQKQAPAKPAPAKSKPAPKPKPSAPKTPASQPEPQFRKPDFDVPGAKPEPANEMPLPDRARWLAGRLASASRPTPKLVRFWLYQHSWIVTGAQFGWKDGDEALRILIRVDRDLQARFGFGARSAALAARVLADVRRQNG